MDENTLDTEQLAARITRLVEERGWNQEVFAKATRLNRHTVRQILQPGTHRRLRNATISACAKALGLTVSELRNVPLEKLLLRINEGGAGGPAEVLRKKYEQATQPELRAWIERNPDRARQLSLGDWDELLMLQGPDGPLSGFGVEAFVGRMERRRALVRQVHTIAGTEYLDLLEQMVRLIYDKVQPSGDGA